MTGALYVAPRRDSRLPAILAAVILHAAVLAFVILVPVRSAMLPVGSSVPINIVSSAPFTDTRQAVQAAQTEAAAAPQPTPQAPPQPPAATPAPPAFSQAASQAPKPPKPTAAQAAEHAKTPPAPPSFDMNRLQQIISQHQRSGGQSTSSAQRGPARPETAPEDRPNAGQGISISDQVGLQQLLERLWNPNCDVAGGSSVKLKVRFIVGLSGDLLGAPNAGGQERSGDAVISAAARRALDAVREAAPYSPPYYGQTITVNFDAKEACAKR